MGNGASSSTGSNNLSKEQQDIKYLGDRFPFGDKELYHLYTAYQRLIILLKEDNNNNDKNNNDNECFLQKFSYQCNQEQINEKIKYITENILPCNFGNALYYALFSTNNSNNDNDDEYTRIAKLEKFFEGLSCCSRRSTRVTINALYKTQKVLDNNSNNNENNNRVSAINFIQTGYKLALSCSVLLQQNDKYELEEELLNNDLSSSTLLQSFAQSIIAKGKVRRQRSGLPGCLTEECPLLRQGLVELDDVAEWCESVAPMFTYILPTIFHFIMFPNIPFPQSRTLYQIPILSDHSEFLSNNNALKFIIACLSPSLNGPYHRLYTSTSDGLSFNRLQNALQGYGGPTILIIRDNNTHSIFGAYTSSSWKESKDFYGNTDCFIYQIHPLTAIYRPKESTANGTNNFMYCNSYARSRGYDQQAHGIGFGGTVDQPRLFIAENFDDNIALSQDLTYENGPLLAGNNNKHFDIETLEVFGVGGSDMVEAALAARDVKRKITEEAIRRSRKVDKAQFLEDFQSGIISSKAFKHRQEIDGRADCDIDELNQKQRQYNYAQK